MRLGLYTGPQGVYDEVGLSNLLSAAASSCRAAGDPRAAPTTALKYVYYLWTFPCLGLGMAQQAACCDTDQATRRFSCAPARGTSIGDIAIAQTPDRKPGIVARRSRSFSFSRYQSRSKDLSAGSDSTAHADLRGFAGSVCQSTARAGCVSGLAQFLQPRCGDARQPRLQYIASDARWHVTI